MNLRNILLATGNKWLVEKSADSYWGIGKYSLLYLGTFKFLKSFIFLGTDGKGENQTGRILGQLRQHYRNRTPVFPPVLIIGDSLVKCIRLEGVMIVPIPGAQQQFVKAAASAIANDCMKCVIVMCGTNDLVSRAPKEPGKKPRVEKRLKPVNLVSTFSVD